MRRLGRVALAAGLVAAAVIGVVFAGAHLLTERSSVARAIAWRESDVDDQFRFPARTIAAGPEVSPLSRAASPEALRRPVSVNLVGRPFETFLSASGTRAFLVVHHDRLVYERYFGARPGDRQTSFSAAKSVVSTLVGIAIDEGLIGGVDDPVTRYVPELRRRDPRFDRVTLRHLLTMSSGLSYTERGTPWSDDAITYYGVDLRDVAVTRTRVEREPGREWRYDNYHPLLLGLVLERATRMPVSSYMSSRLWRPLGAEADATWSLDSRHSGFEKMESGLNARPVDFARFGLMMLHDGRWNGRQIVSSRWVREATAVDVRSDPADFYQYLWWVAPRPARTRSPFFAQGKYGQMIAILPDHDMVIVRMGSSTGDVDWQAQLLALADRIAAAT